MLLGEYPSPQDYNDAYFGLSIATIGAIAAGILLFKIITESKYYSQIIEFKPQRKEDGYSISQGFEKFVGKSGISTTDLRPSGKINIDNQIFQAISTGDYINKNSKIIVLRIDENQMVVAMKDNKTT